MGKRRFRLYKFRTMTEGAEHLQGGLRSLNEADGPVFKMRNDPRITSIGSFLRRTSIDELPQLLNVLRGDMTLVGPRPLPVSDYNGFSEDWHRRRFSVRPGITCLWQVEGRSGITFDRWMELDIQYIEQWSLWLDLKILAKTVRAVSVQIRSLLMVDSMNDVTTNSVAEVLRILFKRKRTILAFLLATVATVGGASIVLYDSIYSTTGADSGSARPRAYSGRDACRPRALSGRSSASIAKSRSPLPRKFCRGVRSLNRPFGRSATRTLSTRAPRRRILSGESRFDYAVLELRNGIQG